jgi:leader peptidase (prepilin peptidase) / N-methyltransferase
MELVVLIYGILIGSFLNVCIYRIPKRISIVVPPSACPECGTRIKFYDLIPVVSFLVLQGRCRNCRAAISFVYPLIEIGTGILTLLLYYKYGFSFDFLKYLCLAYWLVIIAGIDLKHQLIPDVLSISGLAIGLLWAGLSGKDQWIDAILGALIGGGILFLVAYFYPQGMGMGDVKLLAMIGGFLGIKLVLYTLFAGSFLGALIGSVLLLCKVITRKTPIPFGPFLALGAIVSLFSAEFFHSLTWFY